MKKLHLLRKITGSLLLSCVIAAGMERAEAQTIYTFAGNGTGGYSGDGVAATSAELNQPMAAAIDRSGNVYIADWANNRVRKVNASGVISTIAGTGAVGSSGNGGPATAAELNGPIAVATDDSGNVYFADDGNGSIRKVNTLGIISNVAGGSLPGLSGDGHPATAVWLNNPNGVAVDKYGNIYIGEYGTNRVRKVDTAGIISTFAGNGTAGFSGDGGAATAAEIDEPHGVAVDELGNLYVADFTNIRIRKIDTSGIITTFAGNGTVGHSGDGGPATAATMQPPTGVAIDGSGNVYIADYAGFVVRKVDASGFISTFAGNGLHGYSGDGGPATAAELNSVFGVAVDPCSGNLYIGDEANNRIRGVIFPSVITTPTISLSGISTAPAGATVTVNATVGSAGSSYNIYWYNNGVLFATTTTPTATYTQTPGTDTITALIVPTGYGCYDSTTSTPHLVTAVSTGLDVAHGNSLGLILYPNPAAMTVSVRVNASMGMSIVNVYDLVGEEVMREETSGKEATLNIAGLPAGAYIVTVTDEAGNRATGRLVKE